MPGCKGQNQRRNPVVIFRNDYLIGIEVWLPGWASERLISDGRFALREPPGNVSEGSSTAPSPKVAVCAQLHSRHEARRHTLHFGKIGRTKVILVR